MNKYLSISLLAFSTVATSGQPLKDCSVLPIESLMISKEDFYNHEKMIKGLLPHAKKGDGTAQHFLASRLLITNPSEAMKWAKLSVDNGCVDGAILLAMMFDEGIGVNQNSKEAFSWYLLAAEAGNIVAASMVSNMYYQGKGVGKSEEKSLYWLKISRDEL